MEYRMSDNHEHEDMIEDLELYPPWKEALRTFVRAGFTYGDLIPREWFAEAFGLTPPDESRRYTHKELQDYDLALLQNMTAFKEALLQQEQMDLISDQRGSYFVIRPSEQAARALRDMNRRIKNEVGKGLARIQHVDMSQLTTEERRQHMDTLTKAMDMQFRLDMRRRELPDGE
jgi:hypothetical protein